MAGSNLSTPATLLEMQHQEIVPSSTRAPAPETHLPATKPPVSVTPSSRAPSRSVAQRDCLPVVVCLMTVFVHPWPTSVTPFVIISCLSISKRPSARTTVPDVGAAASIAAWIVHHVAAGSPSTGWMPGVCST